MTTRAMNWVVGHAYVLAGSGIIALAAVGAGLALYSGDWRPLLLCVPLKLLR